MCIVFERVEERGGGLISKRCDLLSHENGREGLAFPGGGMKGLFCLDFDDDAFDFEPFVVSRFFKLLCVDVSRLGFFSLTCTGEVLVRSNEVCFGFHQ